MKTINNPSPNFDSRNEQAIDMLVLHYTGMKTAEDALARMCDAQAQVSAHYMVDVDGKIFSLVDEKMRAWHAGVSYWRGNTNINQRSIGIEIVNAGHEFGYTPFPQAQMEAVANLCTQILARHDICAQNVVAHSDIAPTRKQDPGELFDWEFLAARGIGLFPSQNCHPALVAGSGDKTTDIDYSTRPPRTACGVTELNNYGYDISSLPHAITAFQRHFRPKNLSGEWDEECANLLASLLSMI
jgi:N-acetylmuramoyl-L-alanine amidase